MPFIRKSTQNLIISSGETLIVVDCETKKESTIKIPAPVLPPHLTKGQQQIISKESRKVVTCEFSADQNYLALSLENKQVVVLDKTFSLVRNFIVPRVASKVCFSPANDVVVADKTGDVYLYQLLEEDKEPTLLLGHLSMILDMTFSTCGKYIITCDRDEKIRVSHFPNAYNIASFCLGHTQFVIRVVVHGEVLLSASGDGTIKLWNFKNGEEIMTVNTKDSINEKELINTFTMKMDNEKVDVDTLPIVDMQVSSSNGINYLAVSLYQYPFIQIYTFSDMPCQVSHVRNVSVNIPCDFYCNTCLYVLCATQFTCYNVTGSENEIVSTPFSNLVNKYLDLIDMTVQNDILMLYKRKFDNVQEYLEKKKARINSK